MFHLNATVEEGLAARVTGLTGPERGPGAQQHRADGASLLVERLDHFVHQPLPLVHTGHVEYEHLGFDRYFVLHEYCTCTVQLPVHNFQRVPAGALQLVLEAKLETSKLGNPVNEYILNLQVLGFKDNTLIS